jgi:hypothetical protein
VTVLGGNNYPVKGFCMDPAKVGNISVARYSQPTVTGLDSDGVVYTECMSTPNFQGVSTLSFFASESLQVDAFIEDKGTTFLDAIVPDANQYLYLYDETGKAKVFQPL